MSGWQKQDVLDVEVKLNQLRDRLDLIRTGVCMLAGLEIPTDSEQYYVVEARSEARDRRLVAAGLALVGLAAAVWVVFLYAMGVIGRIWTRSSATRLAKLGERASRAR